MQYIKITILFTVMTILLVLMGELFGGRSGMLVFLGISIVINAVSYWFSDKIALKMSGAREVSPQQDPQLHRIVQEVAQMAGIPTPRVYMIYSDAANAFATGRNPQHSSVAVTTGIRNILSERELKGVLSHEIGHVKDRHILIGAIVATMAGTIMTAARIMEMTFLFGGDRRRGNDPFGGILALVLMLLAPISAMIVQLAISRHNEYEADATGAKICGDPLALASALGKLEQRTRAIPMVVNPALAPLYIVHPFNGNGITNLFSTHPPIAKRIERLEAMAQQMPGNGNATYNSLVRW